MDLPVGEIREHVEGGQDERGHREGDDEVAPRLPRGKERDHGCGDHRAEGGGEAEKDGIHPDDVFEGKDAHDKMQADEDAADRRHRAHSERAAPCDEHDADENGGGDDSGEQHVEIVDARESDAEEEPGGEPARSGDDNRDALRGVDASMRTHAPPLASIVLAPFVECGAHCILAQ